MIGKFYIDDRGAIFEYLGPMLWEGTWLHVCLYSEPDPITSACEVVFRSGSPEQLGLEPLE